MEYLPYILTGVLVILAAVLGAVGVQVWLVLNEARRTLHRVNTVVDAIDTRYQQVIVPLTNLGGVAAGLKTGLKIAELFGSWLAKNKDKDEQLG